MGQGEMEPALFGFAPACSGLAPATGRNGLVVEGGTRRVAVECDGDRFHPIEKIAEDMARQAVLERIGWRFIRIRGSQFFRDPDAAMRFVFEALADMGVAPSVQSAPIERPSSSDELLDRVKRRAAEVLRSFDEVLV